MLVLTVCMYVCACTCYTENYILITVNSKERSVPPALYTVLNFERQGFLQII